MNWRISIVAALVCALVYTPIFNLLEKKTMNKSMKNIVTFCICLILVFCINMLVSLIFSV